MTDLFVFVDEKDIFETTLLNLFIYLFRVAQYLIIKSSFIKLLIHAQRCNVEIYIFLSFVV